jgi:hypothetical protein
MVYISVQFLCNFCAICDRDPEKILARQLKYNRKICLYALCSVLYTLYKITLHALHASNLILY